MSAQELAPNEAHDLDGIHFQGECDEEGENRTYAVVDGWAKREFVLEIDQDGGHVDFLEYERVAPGEENARVLAAIAHLARIKNKEILTIEDMDGNLL